MATVKIKIVAARDLPIMDTQSHLTDAYVQVKHKEQSRKTEVVKRTLQPVWDKILEFEIADFEELQEEPVEIRVWDHDTWTADDLIGTVFLDLNTILCNEETSMAAWFPIFDSMRGLRGELYVSLHIKFMYGAKGANPFIPWIPECRDGELETRQEQKMPSIAAETECVMIFAVSRLDPAIYRVERVFGMVEELSLRLDPEHARLQSLRSSRITNEQRITQFFKASGNVRRLLARRTIEHGCNCILGYQEQYDLEPQGGNIIIRAYGTCCQISKIVKEDASKSPAGSGPEDIDRPSMYVDVARRRRHMRNLNHLMKENTKLLTIKSLPCNVVKRIGGVVSARSIKLITQLKTKAVVQERDLWWQEIREEIKANARHFCCNAVIGYTESTTFHEDICVLSASGTAVIADMGAFMLSTPKQMKRQYKHESGKKEGCHIAHVPSTDSTMAGNTDLLVKCLQCKLKPVPAFLLATCEIPPDMPIEGSPLLVEARFVKKKEKETNYGEHLATEISKILPQLEYHIHRQLIHKVQRNGYNAAFGVRVDIKIGALFAVATATATAVHIPCLPQVSSDYIADNALQAQTRSTILKLNLFPSPTPPKASPAKGPGSVEQGEPSSPKIPGSPKMPVPGSPLLHHLTSMSSTSDDESSDTTDSVSDSSESSTQSGSSGDGLELSGAHGERKVRAFVLDIDEHRVLYEDQCDPANKCIMMNIDTMSASPVNLRPSHTISIQRRFELTPAHEPNKRLTRLFQHMHDVLRHKVASLGDCVLACYKSDVSFASDNDINIRIMGFVLKVHNNKQWFVSNLTSYLSEMERRDALRRELLAINPEGAKLRRKVTSRQLREGHSPLHLPQDRSDRKQKKRLSGSTPDDSLRSSFRSEMGGGLVSPTTRSPKRKVLAGLATRPLEEEDTTFRRSGTDTSIVEMGEELGQLDLGSPMQRKKKKTLRYSKPEKWEVPFLQATSPFCFSNEMSHQTAAAPQDVQMLERVESYIMTMEFNKTDVHDEPDSHNVQITPMDYVAGATIVKYLGFLSHHFLRETEKVHSANTYQGGLGTFFHYQTIEANHVIRRIVHSMQGNALLACNVTQHVMVDSDESRAAYHFFTITGQIAQISFE
eukprot:TRINITY_DN20961_c0_g1_i1.p1 TRINITY_DN20961_c0_g1~~TRINITY_DN20961_c0_g1_i1.p1  ORF type:complete len:1112 (+),score=343.57 TRINITY_DN20961_c0_g1_i1:92-3427(+)